jgi:hypothetical protein
MENTSTSKEDDRANHYTFTNMADWKLHTK